MTDRLAHVKPLDRVFLRRVRRSDTGTPIEDLVYRTKRRREEDAWDLKLAEATLERAIQEEMRKQEIVREAARRVEAARRLPATLATKREQRRPTLEFSDNYQIITVDSRPRYQLTPRQAAIVRVLHQRPYCEASSQIIKKQTKCGVIRNSFKAGDGPEIWKNVIVHQPRGFYRLNLTPMNDQRCG